MNRSKSNTSAHVRKKGHGDNHTQQNVAIKGSAPSSRHPHIKFFLYVALFIMLWIFASAIYGSVFYMSQQYSYFAWDSTLMEYLLCQDFGWFHAIGRMLLLTYHFPVLGGAVLALMLTLCAWLIEYTTGLNHRLRFIATLPCFAFLAYFVWLHYDINYQRETSLLMSLPLAALVVLSFIAAAKRLIFRNKKPPYTGKTDRISAILNFGIVTAVFVSLTLFCIFARDDWRRTCDMQMQLEKSDWEGMIDKATSCKRPSRSVAAFYAMALAQTNQLETRLFDIPMNFPPRKVHEINGILGDGVAIYTLDADFYAGIPNSSYHYTMEKMVLNGTNVFYLKRLARAALVNGEKALCWKYLYIIDRNPFEHEFVAQYKELLNTDASSLKQHPDFVHVYNKLPLTDTFDQRYRKPLFLGYNVELSEGRGQEALNASLMALLYSKDISGFLLRARYLNTQMMPMYYQQAIMVRSASVPQILNEFPTVNRQLGSAQLTSFIQAAKPWFKDKERGQKILCKNWQSYYPYYLYFQNLPTAGQKAEQAKEQKKGGVN
jgi:hypothetical protein